MAPKRPAPPPPIESSEETASGSGTDESEDEIAHSPPSVATKNTPPPQKVQQPEASDEEEEEEEEEEVKPNHTVPPVATKNPLPPPKSEKSESDEEEEETDDEAPQPESAPKQEAEGKGGKPPPSSEDKKPAAPFKRFWSKNDEARILEALAAHRREHGTLPLPADLEAALAGSLDNSKYGRKELMGKVTSLKALYTKAVNKGDSLSKDRDRRLFDLCKEIWGGGGDKPANGTVPSDFDEMCKIYPYLAEEMKALERTQPGLFKREFSMIDNEKARALDQKIKKQRVLQMKLELRRHDVTKEVTKALMDLVE